MERNLELNVYRMSFNGQVLKRGFWLYIWKISTSKGEYLYVGRTGDSSSRYAASPFNRIGQHLDFSENAKGNSMARHLRNADIDPLDCEFKMFAIGPLFPEQDSMDKHRPVRDKVAALEFALSKELKKRKYKVLGVHNSKHLPDQQLFKQVLAKIDDDFPANYDRQS